MSKHARRTGPAHPWRRTARTIFAALVAAASMAPAVYVAATHHDPAAATGYAATGLAIAGAVTRVLALPVVEAFLRRFAPFLSAGDVAADQVVALQVKDGPGQTVVAGEASVIATGTPLQTDTTVGDLGQTLRP